MSKDTLLPIESPDAILQYAETLGVTEIHTAIDKHHGLHGIIAIHNTHRGPALGGCRCVEYTSLTAALCDVVRLANGMAYKSAMCGLPHGGAKSVILKPKNIRNRKGFFASFGRFIEQLNGRYIAAVDSGTTVADMDAMATQSKHIVCGTLPDGKEGDPSPYTAIGIRLSIEAAVKFALGKTDLSGLHVALQGVGSVGYFLAEQLHARGVKLTVTDTNTAAVERCVQNFKATAVSLDEIYDVNCDIFAPCALGATINRHTIPRLRCKIVAGCANNQLQFPEDGETLHKRGILYAPDYIANGGGLIYASSLYTGIPAHQVEIGIQNIYTSLMNTFEQSQKTGQGTNFVADRLAEEILAKTATAPLE